jgi:hypothetical protein
LHALHTVCSANEFSRVAAVEVLAANKMHQRQQPLTSAPGFEIKPLLLLLLLLLRHDSRVW